MKVCSSEYWGGWGYVFGVVLERAWGEGNTLDL